jgi:hypothetical protein
MFKLIQNLGTKATRTDFWVICLMAGLGWGMWENNEMVVLTILGYMAADLIGKEVSDAFKAKFNN